MADNPMGATHARDYVLFERVSSISCLLILVRLAQLDVHEILDLKVSSILEQCAESSVVS